MKKSVFPYVHGLVLLSLLGLIGCYSSVTVDSSDEKAIAIDWVDPPCAVPGSEAGYIEGTGFGAENVTITVGGIVAEVIAATGHDASFIVPAEGLSPGETIEVVVMNPGGRLATINWRVCGPGPDIDPPVLLDFDITPTVDVSQGPGEVTCTMSFTDAGVGVDRASCDVLSPSGISLSCTALAPSSGDIFDGTWTCNVSIPQGSESGTWDVNRAWARDHVGNIGQYWTPDLQRLGFPTQFEVVSSSPDTDPPVLLDFDITPTVDVSQGPGEVTCTMSFTDAGVGVDRASCDVLSPSGISLSCTALAPSSGDIFDGTWTCNVSIPQGSESGTWDVNRAWARDHVGNIGQYWTPDLQRLGFPTQFEVVSSSPDTDPPVLLDFDITPTVDVSQGPGEVTCTMSFTDAGVGVDRASCDVLSPSGISLSCTALAPSSGDIFDGTWTCNVSIPQGSESGTWDVNRAWARDHVGNIGQYWTPDLQRLGFPTQFEVTYGGVSGPDTDPPELVDFDFNPKSVDVSTESQSVVVTTSATDAGSGVLNVAVWFVNPSTTAGGHCNTSTPSSGDMFDGTWVCSFTVPRAAEAGTYVIERLRISDAVGQWQDYFAADLTNLGFPSELEVTSSSVPDTDPPELVDFDFNPKSVDVSTESQSVVVTTSATDAGSGVLNVAVWFVNPSTTAGGHCNTSTPSSGDMFDGTWVCSFTVPRAAEAGTYVIERLRISDAVGQWQDYFAADLTNLGFPSELEVTSSSVPDTDPPELVDFDFNPKSVDVSTESQSVVVTTSATDAGSGVLNVAVWFVNPSTTAGGHCNTSTPSSGDMFDGTWVCSFTVPRAAEAGTYVIERLRISDAVGQWQDYFAADLTNLGFPSELEVTYGGGSPAP